MTWQHVRNNEEKKNENWALEMALFNLQYPTKIQLKVTKYQAQSHRSERIPERISTLFKTIKQAASLACKDRLVPGGSKFLV